MENEVVTSGGDKSVLKDLAATATPKGPIYRWYEEQKALSGRFITPEAMRPGDIAEKLSDGRFFIIGTGGQLRKPSPWDRILAWLGR